MAVRFKRIDEEEEEKIRFQPLPSSNNLQNNESIQEVRKPFQSNSIVAIKKNDKKISSMLPIEKGLQKEQSDLPALPTRTIPEKRNLLKESVELVGNTAKTAGKTLLTGTNYLGQGVMKGAEASLDLAVQAGSSKYNPVMWAKTGQTPFSKDQSKLNSLQDTAKDFVKEDLTHNLITKLSGDEKFNQNYLDKDSLIKENNLGGKVVTSIGQMLPSIATGNALAGTTVLGTQAAGGGIEEAYNNGADRTQANLYGAGSAAVEIATEWITGGIPGIKSSGGLDKLVAKGLGQKTLDELSGSLTKEIIKAGYKMVGEAGEEALSEIINPLLKNLTYSKDEKIDWNAVVESAIIGGITGGILEAPTNLYNIKSSVNNKGIDIDTNVNDTTDINENTTINKDNTTKPSIESNNAQNNQNIVQNSANDTTNLQSNVQSENNIVDNLKKYNKELQQNRESNQIKNSVEEITKKVDDINDNSKTFAQDNKTVANVSQNNYNNNEGDINVRQGSNRNISENESNDRTTDGGFQIYEGIQNGISTNDEGNFRGSKERKNIPTIEERREYFERVKNNVIKIPNQEQLNIQKEANDLGIGVNFFNGDNGGLMIGTTDKGTVYLDVNQENLVNESSDLRQRFYHELFHNITRNSELSYKNEINELKNDIIKSDINSINKYLNDRGYDSNLFSDSIKSSLAEEVLADYASKHLANYNVDYNLSPEIEYRLNKLVDDAITTMKLNKKSKDKANGYSGDDSNNVKNLPSYSQRIPINKDTKNLIKDKSKLLSDNYNMQENKIKSDNKTNSIKEDIQKQTSKVLAPIKEDIKQTKTLNKEIKSEVKELKNEIKNLNKIIAPIKEKIVENKSNKLDYIPKDPTKETTYNTAEEIQEKNIKKKRMETIKKYRNEAKEYVSNLEQWQDKSLFSQKINTMKRNLRDVMPKNDADNIYDNYFKPISENNAKIEKEISKYNEVIQKLKLNNKESKVVQMLGEYKYNPETHLTGKEVYQYIEENNLNESKIENAIEVFRKTYDDLLERVNKSLINNGYKEIDARKGYFPHFTETHGKTILGKFAEKLGWRFTKENELPTDIAGMTEFFLPGKKWTSFSQHRTGDFTDYDAVKGYDNYIRGAMDVIYHTEDIQKLRALENEIRYQHSEKGVQDEIDNITNNESLDTEERQELIDQVFKKYDTPLANFVTNLRDYTNNLAGKKSSLDRSSEQLVGRKLYNTMTNVQSRLSANMVGLNISSAMTNFIPITQAWSQVSTKNMVKSIKDTMMSNIMNDNFANESTYLTNRTKQADRLYKTTLDKVSDKAGMLFEAIDDFTSNVIVRGKYLENIDKGMSKREAIKNADEFAKDVMAGRSKGDMPTAFNAKNPMVKLFTAFQLEVNNQYGYMFKDLPKDLKDEGLNKLISAFIKMFLGAWIYNKITSSITGRKSAFSPIDIIGESIETIGNDKISDYDKISKISKNVVQEAPFVSGLLGGGRLPINAALPDVGNTVESITNLGDDKKRDTAIKNLKSELSKPVLYVAMPFGGGQVKKTIEGLSMYSSDKEVPGSYTASGKLRFPVKDNLPSKVQSAIFGQYSSKEAQEYFGNGYAPLTEKQIKKYRELNIPISEYWANREEKNYSVDHKEKYATINAITSYDNYKQYNKDINEIKKKYEGSNNNNKEEISNKKKNEIFKYIDSIGLNKTKTAMLKKMYYKSYTNYDNEIVKYVEKQNFTTEEKKNIYKTLGMYKGD